MKSFVCVLIPNSCPWEGSLWLRQVCWPHSKLCVDVQWPAPLDPSLGSTTYWLGEGGQVVWLWADWACLWVPFSSILNPGKPHGTPSSVAGQTEEATFASSPGPEAPHRWAAPSSDVLHLSFPFTGNVPVSGRHPTTLCDLFLSLPFGPCLVLKCLLFQISGSSSVSKIGWMSYFQN